MPIQSCKSKLLGVYRGSACRGLGRASGYVQHPAYRPLFETFLYCKPYPGTLNVKLDDDSARAWSSVISRIGPCTVYNPRFEGYKPVGIVEALVYGIIPAIIVIPTATLHPPDVIEIVACQRLWELVVDKPIYIIAGCRLLNCWRLWLQRLEDILASLRASEGNLKV